MISWKETAFQLKSIIDLITFLLSMTNKLGVCAGADVSVVLFLAVHKHIFKSHLDSKEAPTVSHTELEQEVLLNRCLPTNIPALQRFYRPCFFPYYYDSDTSLSFNFIYGNLIKL